MKELKFIKIESQDNKSLAICKIAENNNPIETPAGKACKIRTEWSLTDYWGQI
ncbi:MAG: hypothetical protein HY754_12210, partial [Nitrospirae bacterium]|nr:hypothetical protein [Nitrospirota bacterium]